MGGIAAAVSVSIRVRLPIRSTKLTVYQKTAAAPIERVKLLIQNQVCHCPAHPPKTLRSLFHF